MVKKFTEVSPYTGRDIDEAPTNTTGPSVAGTGDDSSVVVVRKKKKKDLLYDGRTRHARRFVERILKMREKRKVSESKMSDLHAMIADGSSAQEISKELKIPLKTVKELMKGFKEEVELEEKPRPLPAKYVIYDPKKDKVIGWSHFEDELTNNDVMPYRDGKKVYPHLRIAKLKKPVSYSKIDKGTVQLGKSLKSWGGGVIQKEEVELDEVKLPSYKDLVKYKYSDDHGGAVHYSKFGGKDYKWNYVGRKGGKYFIDTKKQPEIRVDKVGVKNVNKIVKEEVELEEVLKPKDKKVVDAFYDGKSMKGDTLSTDGKKLEKSGLGAQTIATSSGGKFKIVAKMDSKHTQSTVAYMKKSFPKKTLSGAVLDYPAKYHNVKEISEGLMATGLFSNDPKEINKAGFELTKFMKRKPPANVNGMKKFSDFVQKYIADDNMGDTLDMMAGRFDDMPKTHYSFDHKMFLKLDPRGVVLNTLIDYERNLAALLLARTLINYGVQVVQINMDKARQNMYSVDVGRASKKSIQSGIDGLYGTMAYKGINYAPKTEVKEMNFTKSVLKQSNEFAREYELVENNLKVLQNIVKNKQNMKMKFKDKQAKVDLFTASAIMNVYNAVRPDNKKKLEKLMNGKIADFMKLQSFAMKQIK